MVRHAAESSDRDEVTPIKRSFQQAMLSAPAMIVIDDLDVLDESKEFCKGSEMAHDRSPLTLFSKTAFKAQELDRTAIASQLADQLRNLPTSSDVCVLASCENIARLPPSLRKINSGSGDGFDRVIELGMPSRKQREDIVWELLEGMSLAEDEKVGEESDVRRRFAFLVSQSTPGYVARDLYNLVSRAAANAAVRHHQSEAQRETTTSGPDALVERLAGLSVDDRRDASITFADFQRALSIITPFHGNAEGLESKKPNIRWEEIGGYEALKSRLIKLATWPLERPEVFERLGIQPPSGILLYGPSGCGKTSLVHALAAGSPMNFMSIKGSEVFSKYLGESEASVRKTFTAARRLAPCLLFLDELDALGTRREWTDEGTTGVNERVLSTFLNEMDGVQERKGVLVVACTNRPWKLDDALLRPGRFDHHLHVRIPSREDRVDILRRMTVGIGEGVEQGVGDENKTRRRTSLDKDVDIEKIADATVGFSGSDLKVLLRESAILALRENSGATFISQRHIAAALEGAIKESDLGVDPFEATLVPEEKRGGIKMGWWRPAWVPEEDLMQFEAFERGGREG
ncbi:hypothetical protein HDV00_008188 [Rhizophlyctis rosea]|nr:hypothetical protein HDV00_008188 [Rhizophlyctis rosea]